MSSNVVGSDSKGASRGAFAPYVESFARERGLDGRARHWSARVGRGSVLAFARWAEVRGVVPNDTSDEHVVEFLACGVGAPASRANVDRQRAVLGRFLEHLRRLGVARSPGEPADADPVEVVLRRYVHHLRGERGLAERSVAVYLPYARRFMVECVARSGADLDAAGVRRYFLDRVRGRPVAYAQLVAAALRSILRFLFLQGATATDGSRGIPRIQRPRQAAVHAFLTPEEVDRALRHTDRTTGTGRRDYAILMLLARLGLRGGEVARLDLRDVRWRAAEIAVRGKGDKIRVLPLPLDAGRALARYVQLDRPASASHRVFLRRIPPYVGLSGPAAIGHVVRCALVRAGIRDASRRGASHLFRHGLATCMLRRGATIPQIAEVLGHRSIGTTEVYAKVDFESLRAVALPWPLGGAR